MMSIPGRNWVMTLAVGLGVGLLATPSVEALTINRIDGGGVAPGSAVGGGNLAAIFNKAADWWEMAILDNHTIDITYQWGDNSGFGGAPVVTLGVGPLPTPTAATVQFNNAGTNWFLDPTPGQNEEYDTFTESFDDLGGGVVNTGRVYTDPTGHAVGNFDLLTAAKHDIGHALGLLTNVDQNLEILAPLLGAGSMIPILAVGGGHIDVDTALINVGWLGSGQGERRVQSAIDILAVAQMAGFENLNECPHDGVVVPEPVTAGLGLLGLGALAGATRRRGG